MPSSIEVPEGYEACPLCEARGYLATPDLLARLRVEAGVTLETVAEFSATRLQTIGDIFLGKVVVTRERERKILSAIDAAVRQGRTSARAYHMGRGRRTPPRRR